jgi:glycosyltransferase involved in cell wall biosynthesis
MERPISVLCVTPWGDRAEAAAFIGLRDEGCHVKVLCRVDSAQRPVYEEAGIDVVCLPFEKRIDRVTISRMKEELRAGDYDIVHLLHNVAVSNGLLALRKFPEPKVIAYRGIVGNVSFFNPGSWMRYLNPRIDRVICVCEAIRKYFLEMSFLGLRLNPKKFVTVYKGHDLSWYTDEPIDLREFGIPDGAFVVGCVANMRPRKGVEVLIEAFSSLPEDLPIYLLLAGYMDSARLDKAIARSKNAARIRKLGFRRDAPALIGACQVAVLPSLRREGLPKTVIEAMAYGVTPIVTNVGGSAELVVDGESGLVVPPGDADAMARAILTLYNDESFRRRAGAAARERLATRFHTTATVSKTLAVYRDVLAS